MVSPLTALTQNRASTGDWPTFAVQTFSQLKSCFSAAPVLHMNHERTLFLEDDASSIGVGAGCSQQSSKTNIFIL